jgi:hypothetical protein
MPLKFSIVIDLIIDWSFTIQGQIDSAVVGDSVVGGFLDALVYRVLCESASSVHTEVK